MSDENENILVKQAKAWAETRSLWYYVRRLSLAKKEDVNSVLEELTAGFKREIGQEEYANLQRQAIFDIRSKWESTQEEASKVEVGKNDPGSSDNNPSEAVHVEEKDIAQVMKFTDEDIHEMLVLLKMKLSWRAKNLNKSEPYVVYHDRGVLGDTVPHLCLLLWMSSSKEKFRSDWARSGNFLRRDYEAFPSARLLLWMMHFYGMDIIDNPYHDPTEGQDSIYEGETLLHMAIVKQDLELVKYFCENGANMRARATGAFFAGNHFGEFPLSFAAHTGCQKIVDFLLIDNLKTIKQNRMWDSNTDTLNVDAISRDPKKLVDPTCDKDSEGNTVLHICVYKENMEMYAHLVSTYDLGEFVLNNQSLSPLTLAAYLGHQRSFTAIVDRRREVLWAFGSIVCKADPMTEHETALFNLGVPSTLKVVVQQNKLDMMSEPFLIKLVETKWKNLLTNFWGLFIFFVLCSGIFSIAIFATQDDRRIWSKRGTVVFSSGWLVSTLYYVRRIFIEVMDRFWLTIRAEKHSAFSTLWQVLLVAWEIIVRWVRSGLILLAMYSIGSIYLMVCTEGHSTTDRCPVHGERSILLLKVITFFANMLFNLWFFLSGVEFLNIGLYVLIVWRCFWLVICPFAVLYLFLMLPTALVLHLLAQHTQEDIEYFSSIAHSVTKMFSVGMSGMAYDDFELGNENILPGMTTAVLMVYTLIVYILLLNLLIAILSSEIEGFQNISESQVRMQQARIVLWIERMPITKLTHRKRLQVGDPDPSPEPFNICLESVGSQVGVDYHSFKILVTIKNWTRDWSPAHTLMVKRMVLDACMKKPVLFVPRGYIENMFCKSVDVHERSIEGKYEGSASISDVDLHLLTIKIPEEQIKRESRKAVRNSLNWEVKMKQGMEEGAAQPSGESGGEEADKEHLFFVTNDEDHQNAMKQKMDELRKCAYCNKDSKPASDTDSATPPQCPDGVKHGVYQRQVAGLAMWRGGCVLRGGGLKELRTTTEDVNIEFQLYVPVEQRRSLVNFQSGRWSNKVQSEDARCRLPVEGLCGMEDLLDRLVGSNSCVTFNHSLSERLLSIPHILASPSADDVQLRENLQVSMKVLQQSAKKIVDVKDEG